jgi:hypothetical protein
MRAGWDGTFEGASVPTGPATVAGVFPVIGVEGEVPDTANDAHPVLVSTRAAIVGDAASGVLAPGVAIDAALGDTQFVAWLRDGAVNRWLNPDVARIGNTWQVGLFKTNENGLAVAYQGVIIDGAGQIVGHRGERSG